MNLTNEKIQKLSGDFIFLRGKEYYRAGLVRSLAWEGQSVRANVHGSGRRSYKVTGSFAHGKPVLRCTCPNNLGALCKHSVAVLLYLLDHGEVIDDGENSDDNDPSVKIPAKHPVPETGTGNPSLKDFLYAAYESPQLQLGITIKSSISAPAGGIHLTLALTGGKEPVPITDIDNLLLPARHVLNDHIPSLSAFSNDQRIVLHMIGGFIPSSGDTHETAPWKIKPVQLAILVDYLSHSAGIDLVTNKDLQKINIIRDTPVQLNVNIKTSSGGTVVVSAVLIDPLHPELPVRTGQIFAAKNLWVFSPEDNTFHMVDPKVEYAFLEHFLNIEREIDINERKHFLADVLPKISSFSKLTFDDPLLYSVRVANDPFVPAFVIDEENDELSLGLFFDYGSQRIDHSKLSPDIYHETMSGQERILLRRDIFRENEIVLSLINHYKFYFDDKQGRFFLSSQNDIFNFLSIQLHELTLCGSVFLSARAKAIYSKDDMIGPRVRVSSSDIDWFSYNIAFTRGGKAIEIPEKVIFDHLSSGKNFVRLKTGEFVSLDAAAFGSLSKLLEDRERKGRLMLAHIPFIIDELKAKGITVEPDPETQRLYDQLKSFKGIDAVAASTFLKGVLRDYQCHGVNWMTFLKKFRFGGILADEMGLGKTLQALTMIQNDLSNQCVLPSLVVCPTTLVWNWEAEVLKFFPETRALVIGGNDRLLRIKEIPKAKIVITSYALLRRDIEHYRDHQFQYLILDEAQNIRNRHTISARVTKQLNAKHRLALTGTPLENSLADIWSIFDFLMPSFLGSYDYFRTTYEIPVTQNQDTDKLKELSRRIAPFVLRRLKQDVIKEIPEKIEQTAFCELEPAQAKLYAAMADKARTEVIRAYSSSGFSRSRMLILKILLRLRQICCHPELAGINLKHRIGISAKTDLFKEMLQELLSSGHRVLVFSQFVQMLGIIRDHLDKENIPYEYMDGQTKDRQQRVEHFNTDPEIQVFLLSLKVGGLGLNLTSADSVILYEPWWNPAVEQQAIDRTHRIGQKRSVLAYHLIARGTIEEKIVELQKRKNFLMSSIVLSDESMSKKIGWDDIKFLLDIKDDAPVQLATRGGIGEK